MPAAVLGRWSFATTGSDRQNIGKRGHAGKERPRLFYAYAGGQSPAYIRALQTDFIT